MTQYSAIFLDRDGTIIEDRGYLKHPSELVLYPESIEALKKLQKKYLLFIVTNQSGIARGLTTDEEVGLVNATLVDLLKSHSIHITDVFYCPHVNEDNCNCKKPSPYFLKKASELYHIDLESSYMIGDHPSDVMCGVNAGATPIYVLTGHGEKHLKELEHKSIVVSNILEAVNYICK